MLHNVTQHYVMANNVVFIALYGVIWHYIALQRITSQKSSPNNAQHMRKTPLQWFVMHGKVLQVLQILPFALFHVKTYKIMLCKIALEQKKKSQNKKWEHALRNVIQCDIMLYNAL